MNLVESLLKVEPINLLDHREEFEHLRLLENTIQDPKWHGEGNVLIHTNMVLEKAYELAQSIENPEERINLYLGAFLHDFGKPFTTSVHNGKVVAYGHEGVGVTYARDFLRKHFPMLNFARREYILNLVEYHGHPKRLVQNGSDDLRFKQLSLEASMEQLYQVEVADFTGRTGEIPGVESLKMLDAFKERSKSLDVWNHAYWIPNSDKLQIYTYNLARWNILFHDADETKIEKFASYDKLIYDKPFELVLLIGAPGSGKTTYCSTIFPHVEKVSMDDERARLGDVNDMSKNQEVYETCYRKLVHNMKNRISSIWDATSVNRKMRYRLVDMARQKGAIIRMVFFDVPLETILERNRNRDRVVPDKVVEDYYRRLQVPASYEYDRFFVVHEKTPIGK